MIRIAFLLVLLTAGICPGAARAQATAQGSNAAQAPLRAALDKVRQARELNEQDFRLAKVAAATWVFVGPCQGDTLKLMDRSTAAVALVMTADPKVPYQAATLEMIAMLLRSPLGRPNPAYCDLVLKIAREPLSD